jgi:hypothetical protein
MRILVCGGRDFSDYDYACKVLDALHAERPIRDVIHGNSRGADKAAEVWAYRRRADGVSCWPVPAQWSKYGKAAGPKRNQSMIGLGPDLVVAFPGGRGTADMVRRAEVAGIKVMRVSVPSPLASTDTMLGE